MQTEGGDERAPTAAMAEENVAWMLRMRGVRTAVIPTLRITFYLPRGAVRRVFTPRRRRPLPLPSK